jgi:uncharacterized protein (TIGR03435 family)
MQLFLGLLCGGIMVLFGQDPPDFPPSYEVHISPTSLKENGTSDTSGPGYWGARGYDLRAIIAKVCQVDKSRIELPPSLEDGTRYDFAMVLPKMESQTEIDRLVQRAVEDQFHITMAFETRLTDVYVLTAPNGKTPAMKASRNPAAGGGFSGGSLTVAVDSPNGERATPEEIQKNAKTLLQPISHGPNRRISFIGGVSASNSTMEAFCHILEFGLDRLVIDETNLGGTYDLEVQGEPKSTEQFFALLRDQLGFVVTPGQRNVKILVVRRT